MASTTPNKPSTKQATQKARPSRNIKKPPPVAALLSHETPLSAKQAKQKVHPPRNIMTEDVAVDQAYDRIYRYKMFSEAPQPLIDEQSLTKEELQQNEAVTYQLKGQDSFDKLMAKIEENPDLQAWSEMKLRCHWSASSCELVLLLEPNLIHEVISSHFHCLVTDKLKEIVKKFPSLIKLHARLDISAGRCGVREWKKGSLTFLRFPSGQIQSKDVDYPPFVFEVGWGNSETKNKAVEYMKLGGGGQVCTFVGLDIDHYNHAAWVTLWRVDLESDDHLVAQPILRREQFRDKHGKAIPGKLRLPFKCFIPVDERDKIPKNVRDATITIDFEHLASIVALAEAKQQEEDASRERYDEEPRHTLTIFNADGKIIEVLQGRKTTRKPRKDQTSRTSVGKRKRK